MRSSWVWNPQRPQSPPPASGGPPGPPVESPFPVHPLLWHPVRTRIDADRAPHGRIVGVEYTYDYQPSEEVFQRSLGPNDVVWVPLFDGTIRNPAHDFSRRRVEYEDNVRAISVIGPDVRAILCGNANAEIRFADCSSVEEHERCMTFVEKHCQFMSNHGRPAFAPVFEILVHDCYNGGCVLRDLFLSHNALILSFAGCSWLVQEPCDHPRIPESRPYRTLSQYLSTLETLSGVGTLRGLENGSGDVLRSMGYSAGFAGWY